MQNKWKLEIFSLTDILFFINLGNNAIVNFL